MRARSLAAALALAAVLGAACGKSRPAGVAGNPDAGTGGDGALASCLEEPGGLQRPPNGRLPCELIPPGVRIE